MKIVGYKSAFWCNDFMRRILDALYKANRIMKPNELKHKTEIPKPTLFKYLKELKEGEYITYEGRFNSDTGRPGGAELTKKGETEMFRLAHEHNRLQTNPIAVPTTLPVYIPQNNVSGTSLFVGPNPLTVREQEELQKIAISTAAKINAVLPSGGTLNFHFLVGKTEDKKDKKK